MATPETEHAPEKGELVPFRAQASIMPASTLPSREEYSVMVGMANALAKAHGFIPSHFGGDGNKVLAAIMYGRDLGFSPTQSLQHIIVIDGKATTDAQAAGMLIRRAGHKLHDDTTNERSRVTITRWDDPDHPFEAVFTIEDATRAGLIKPNSGWTKYPRAMLYARALMECARKGCQDALMGVAYVAEELGAEVDASGRAIAPEYQTGPEPPPMHVMAEQAETGEVAPEQATAASREILDQAAGTGDTSTTPGEVKPPSIGGVSGVEAESPPPVPAAADPDTSEGRARRGVGPTPKRTNVATVHPPGPAEPLPAQAEESQEAEAKDEVPAPTVPPAAPPPVYETPASLAPSQREGEASSEQTDAFAPPEATDPHADQAEWTELIRHKAAQLWQIRVRQSNRKRALEGKPLAPEPPATPNEDSDRALNVFVASQFKDRSVGDLRAGDLENLHGALEGLVSQMLEREPR